MLSKTKLTFSLTSFVVCLMIAFVGTAMGDGDQFSASFTPGELMVDVSTIDHSGVEDIQVASGRSRGAFGADARDVDGDLNLEFALEFGKVVQLVDHAPDTVAPSGKALGLDDFTVEAFDDLQRSLGTLSLSIYITTGGQIDPMTDGVLVEGSMRVATLSYRTPQAVNIADPGELPGRQFRLSVDYDVLIDAYPEEFEIHTLLFQLAHGAVIDASLAIRQDVLSGKDNVKIFHSEGPKFLRVDLVDDDEGDARYARLTGASTADRVGDDIPTPSNYPGTAASGMTSGVPGVVAVERVLTTSGIAAIATTPFDVRIILTEEPAAFTAANIMVLNGTAAAPVRLLPLASDAISANDFHDRLRYMVRPATPVEFVVGSAPDTIAKTELPDPTGRDNMYHVYSVMITPTPGLTNQKVTVSVGNFEDQVLPNPKKFVALTQAELLADSLTGAAEVARNLRIRREAISVQVTIKATADIFKPSADARLTHEKFINEKLVIPANGYLVLASGAYAQAGVLSAAAKLADKKRVGETLYNTVEKFNPPYPGDDLANLFRNGATIQLAYQNISGNTAVADAAGADDTGYDGASDDVYAPGTVIINEIMWGYDRGIDNRAYTEGQWIELHNTTAAPISLDKQEWMLVYGATTSFAAGTVMDTVSNNPSTGYWKVPGQSGVSSSDPVVKTGVAVEKEGTKEDIQILDRDIVDVVSISRVAGGPDGTAASSWATSILPSANFSSVGRIGTPGAMNIYDTSLQEVAAAAAEVVASTAPVAAAKEIVVSEIMVDSNDGRLPQWIELANISGKEVSLNGWSIVINNDPADAGVVGGSVNLVIGDVTVGKDQVVLIVSKAGRNSGVSDRAAGDTNEGDLDLKRIVDVQSQVSPGDDQYMLISEMGFRISLIVSPAAGGVITTSDVVGNLGMEWEVPMAEGNRSSIIRREMKKAAAAAAATGVAATALSNEIMGTDAAGWVLASDTTLGGAHRETYYGQASDVGTPGYDAGGALPVELSGFGAKRDPLTGAVVITWATQSELNNAGFFIKRSQQKDGKFVIVNPTMIAGAGTTAEKQSYTYTDATADPNVIYYYQIEDVSLDGNRQTLTRAHRLKGHIGAAGKATTTWGELKSSRE